MQVTQLFLDYKQMDNRPFLSDPIFEANGTLNNPNTANNGFQPISRQAFRSYACLNVVEPLLDQLERDFPSRDTLDEQFIERVAFAPVPDGKTLVLTHHTVRFMRNFGPALAKLEPHLAQIEANDAALRATAADLETKRDATKRYIDIPGDGVPWTAWPRCKLAFILLAAFFFIAVETNSVATTLRESGIPSFVEPLRALFFTSVPLGLALLLKLFRDWLDHKVDRRIHALLISTVGILFGGWWLWLFASTFPGIAQSLDDITGSLDLATQSTKPNAKSAWLIFTGLAAAACVAAVAWSAAEDIVQAHRTTRRIDNQAFVKTQADLDALCQAIEPQGVILRRARKLVERINKEHEDYLVEAETSYRAYEAAAGYQRAVYVRLYGSRSTPITSQP